MEKVQTVLGELAGSQLGRTLIHEHALVGFPGWFLDNRQPKHHRDEALARVTCTVFYPNWIYVLCLATRRKNLPRALLA